MERVESNVLFMATQLQFYVLRFDNYHSYRIFFFKFSCCFGLEKRFYVKTFLFYFVDTWNLAFDGGESVATYANVW